MDRRDYLAISASMGMTAFAGCSFTASASTVPPDVPQQRLDDGGWSQTNETTRTVLDRSYGPLTLTAIAHTIQYADEELTQKISDRTLGQIETALSVFFATRVDFSPNIDDLPAGVGTRELVSQIETSSLRQFKQRMAEQGLEQIEETGTGTLDVDTGETADVTKLSAVFPFDGITFDVTEAASVEIPGSDIGVTGLLAVWHHGDFTLVSGGAYPSENFQTTVKDDLSEGISITVDVDLGLEPRRYREEIRGLITSVE